MRHHFEVVPAEGEIETPSSTIDYRTSNFNTVLLYVGTTFALFATDNHLKGIVSMKDEIQAEVLDAYKEIGSRSLYSESEDYGKILTDVVTGMLSNKENFSDIDQYINDNFWDLV